MIVAVGMVSITFIALVVAYIFYKNGKVITKPLYTAIDAISKDVFVCDLDYGGVKITINSKGEVVK